MKLMTMTLTWFITLYCSRLWELPTIIHLLRANIKINEEHEEVTAHLVPEPQNERDADAISVQINYGDGPCHVGYIPKELAKYIHPLLKENAITKVEIGHIIFSLKWYRVGFYMKILITRMER